MTIIKEPMPDKIVMFECGEVLHEILKAVDQGKKALRLDYTPYKIYSLYKRKLQKTEEPIKESEEEDENEKNRKKEAVAGFLEKHSHFLKN